MAEVNIDINIDNNINIFNILKNYIPKECSHSLITSIKLDIKTEQLTDIIENEDNTYLLYNGKNYKIGHSVNIKSRLVSLRTGSDTHIELIGCSVGGIDLEKELHYKYSSKKIKREWFDLNNSEVQEILNIFKIKREEHKKLKENKNNEIEILQDQLNQLTKKIEKLKTTNIVIGIQDYNSLSLDEKNIINKANIINNTDELIIDNTKLSNGYYKVNELKLFCKLMGRKGYSKLTKQELIDMIKK